MTTDRTTALHIAGLAERVADVDHPCFSFDADYEIRLLLDRLERAEAVAVGSPAFRAALDKVFTEPGEDFGPARGYYRPYLDEFVAALLAALDSAASDD